MIMLHDYVVKVLKRPSRILRLHLYTKDMTVIEKAMVLFRPNSGVKDNISQ